MNRHTKIVVAVIALVPFVAASMSQTDGAKAQTESKAQQKPWVVGFQGIPANHQPRIEDSLVCRLSPRGTGPAPIPTKMLGSFAQPNAFWKIVIYYEEKQRPGNRGIVGEWDGVGADQKSKDITFDRNADYWYAVSVWHNDGGTWYQAKRYPYDGHNGSSPEWSTNGQAPVAVTVFTAGQECEGLLKN